MRIEADSLYNASKKAEELYPEYSMSMGSPLMKGDYIDLTPSGNPLIL